LYKSVPLAARRDPRLYELLALVDAIRGEDEEIRELAVGELRMRLSVPLAPPPNEQAAQEPRRAAAAKIVKRGSYGKEGRVYRGRHRDP
jgi:hypothetical protein